MKVLVSCGNDSKCDRLLNRVSKLNKSNTFEALFCIGGLHPQNTDQPLSDYLSGASALPIATYVFGAIPSGLDVNSVENLHLLGRSGFTTVGKLSIAYYIESPTQDTNATGEKRTRNTNEDFRSLEALLKEKKEPCDVLITTNWPSDILNNIHRKDYPSDMKEEGSPPIGSSLVKKLNELCQPRYHFVTNSRNPGEIAPLTSQVYFERIPFKHPSSSHVCRFISIAEIDTKAQKWLYASNITPLEDMTNEQLAAIPPHTTESPFVAKALPEPALKKFKPTEPTNLQVDSSYGAFGSLSGGGAENEGRWNNYRYSRDRGERNSAPKTIDSCWFCIDSDKVAEHLIASIGDESYLALPKGGIVPDHVLIIPLDHVTSPYEMKNETLQEIAKYKESLREYAKKTGKNMVFFERNVRTQYGMVHYLIQCVPIPDSKSSEEIQKIFEQISATRFQISYKVLSNPNEDINDHVEKNSQYFLAELPDKKRLLHVVANSRRHPLQLGREILAELLGQPERKNWKECEVSKSDEVKLTNQFKNSFKPFDFTL